MKSFFSILVVLSIASVLPLRAQTTETMTIVSDGTWRITENEIDFGEYPLSYERIKALEKAISQKDIAAHTSKVYGPSKLIPGTTPIWRRWKASDSGDQYAILKKVFIPGDVRIKQVNITINCDDAARIYINGKLLQAAPMDREVHHPKRNFGTYRQLTAFMYDEIYTYNASDYLFTNHENTILAELVNSPHHENHAYLSFKMEVLMEKTLPLVVQPPAPAPKPVATVKPAVTTPTPKPILEQPKPEPVEQPKPTATFDAHTKAESLKIGDVLELKNIYFQPDKYDITTQSEGALRILAKYLQDNPRLNIEIGGHTNMIPKDDFCLTLSTNRAKAVYDYLVVNQIAANRLTFKGYGKQYPKVNAINKAANAQNQRVEIKVLGN